jgi:hypothetical protein
MNNRMAQGTFHFSTHLFLSNSDGSIFERNIELDHPANHHEVRLQSCPIIDKNYTLSVRLLGMERRRMRIRYDSTIWFGDEEVFSIKNEEMIVDAGRWMQIGVVNLQDELTTAECQRMSRMVMHQEDGGILILPGVEERNDDEAVRDFRSSYMRVFINFVEVGGEDVVILPRRVVTIAQWAAWTLFGYAVMAMQ